MNKTRAYHRHEVGHADQELDPAEWFGAHAPTTLGDQHLDVAVGVPLVG